MSLDACADLVSRGDPDRFRSVLAAPIADRTKLLPIYAFNVEVTRAPWVTEEPMIAEMRLQWWRDVLEEIELSKPVRAHEVATELAKVTDSAGAAILDKLVAARRWDIYKEPFEDPDHFADYLDATSGGLMWVSARLLGASSDREAAYRRLGFATGLAALFSAIPILEDRGRKPMVDGRPEAIAALAKKGQEGLEQALRDGATGPASYPAWMAGQILRAVAAQPDRVATGDLGISEFSRRIRMLRTSVTGRVPR